ncbi:unnamed protein product [Hymenolepis diminuta]|uniref:Uncharacterized protein n=1 Tax=Hymenolepis diminuta TaxID=6216 RepID=A0A564YAB0_HYMDI|nr:unnamed protein product [Hymenolepis diminuta]
MDFKPKVKERKIPFFIAYNPMQVDSPDGKTIHCIMPSVFSGEPRVYTVNKYEDHPLEWLERSVKLWTSNKK